MKEHKVSVFLSNIQLQVNDKGSVATLFNLGKP